MDFFFFSSSSKRGDINETVRNRRSRRAQRDTRITVNSETEMDIFTIAISGDYIVMFVVSHDTIKCPSSRAGST